MFRVISLVLLLYSLGTLSGCERMINEHRTELTKNAAAKASDGDYAGAVNLYEAALDGTRESADIHYQLGLLYDDKLEDPLNALHHFKRFLMFEPTGKRAEEVKGFMKRDELTLVTKLSGDPVLTRADAVKLRNENLELRKQIEERWVESKTAAGRLANRGSRTSPNESKSRRERTYTVQPGDTLASISRKFYQSSAHWQLIMEANAGTISKPGDLKPGQTLTIP